MRFSLTSAARLKAWLPWLACAMVGVFIGLGAYTFRYAEGASYLSNDPKACMNCHIMREQHDSWVRSSHHRAATCNDCHVPHAFPDKYLVKAENGWNHSRKFTLQNYPDPIRITPSNLRVLQHNCIHCHSGIVSGIAAHSDIERNQMQCTTCHRSVGHMSLD
jgi:cytochrome c nitrite reductase small subunit